MKTEQPNKKNIIAIIVGTAITLATIYGIFWAAGKGWHKGAK